MSMPAETPSWVSRLDPELARSAQMQPYVAFTDPWAARKNFARATRLSRALRGTAVSTNGIGILDRMFSVPGEDREIKVRVYTPDGVTQPAPALVYFHGGAFLAGDLDTEHDRCVRLGGEAGCVIVSVDYRRPPEHPFPAPGEDCFAATNWVISAAAELGISPERVAVGGSSAGATLAAAVALMARDRGGPRLALQMLLYPALDDRLATGSVRRFSTTSWTIEDYALMWRHYLGESRDAATSPYAVPARCSDFRGVAPAYVLAVEVDALRDEAIEYAVRMLRDGVRVELHHLARAFHGFDAASPQAALSVRSLADQSAALRNAFRL